MAQSHQCLAEATLQQFGLAHGVEVTLEVLHRTIVSLRSCVLGMGTEALMLGPELVVDTVDNVEVVGDAKLVFCLVHG
jgi:hypothetical protein